MTVGMKAARAIRAETILAYWTALFIFIELPGV
jgi:hypothetical protein